LPFGDGRFVTVYRSHSLAKGHSKATRALVVIHGAGRNAEAYFPSGMAGAYLAGALEDTVVVAPRFAGGDSLPFVNKFSLGRFRLLRWGILPHAPWDLPHLGRLIAPGRLLSPRSVRT